MSDVDLRAAAAPKSDQLNADDLVGAPKTVKITDVKAGTSEQPVLIHHDGGKPYKPCKGMIRVMILAWGDKGKDWVGKSMTLYNDPSVKWAGVEVGGIRISHVSHIKTSMTTSVTVSKGQRKPYRVDPLKVEEVKQPEPYPADKFEASKAAMQKAIQESGKTPAQVIAQCEKTGLLSKEQKDVIEGFAVKAEQPAEQPPEEEVY